MICRGNKGHYLLVRNQRLEETFLGELQMEVAVAVYDENVQKL